MAALNVLNSVASMRSYGRRDETYRMKSGIVDFDDPCSMRDALNLPCWAGAHADTIRILPEVVFRRAWS